MRLKGQMGDGAEENNISGNYKQPWRKREGDIDVDLYHCIWDPTLTNDMQNNDKHKGIQKGFQQSTSASSSPTKEHLLQIRKSYIITLWESWIEAWIW